MRAGLLRAASLHTCVCGQVVEVVESAYMSSVLAQTAGTKSSKKSNEEEEEEEN